MKPGTRGRNILLYAASEKSADIQYASGFSCPDPFIFVRTGKGRRIMVMSDLEIDRARATARAHRVLPLARFTRLARERKPTATTGDVIAEVLRELKIRGVVVPPDFDVAIADQLRSRNIGVRPLPAPFLSRSLGLGSGPLSCILPE